MTCLTFKYCRQARPNSSSKLRAQMNTLSIDMAGSLLLALVVGSAHVLIGQYEKPNMMNFQAAEERRGLRSRWNSRN